MSWQSTKTSRKLWRMEEGKHPSTQHKDCWVWPQVSPGVRLRNPCLYLGSSHVHSMGLQFSVKPSGNSTRDRNSYLNTGKSNHCPPDGWMLEHSSECSWKCRHQSSKSTRLVLWLLRSPQQKPSFRTGRQRVTFGNCLWVPGQPESEAAFHTGKADASTKPQTFSQRNT